MRRAATILLTAAGIALAACSADEPTAAGDAIGVEATVTPDADGTDLLAITAPVVGGGTIDLAAYASEPLALWFWAPY